MRIKKVVALMSTVLLIVVDLSNSLCAQSAARANTLEAQLLNFPLWFEKNVGQADANVDYFSHQRSCSFYFAAKEIVIVLPSKTSSSSLLKIQFAGATSACHLEGMDEQEGRCNYFIGSDTETWLTNVPTYAKVYYKDLYPGIDATFYGNKGRLEYDICVAPGGDPHNVCLHVEGAKNLVINNDGNLHISTNGSTEIAMLKPCIYQISDGNKIFIEGEFVLLAHDTIGFHLEAYDTDKSLIIDPVLDYSTYLGGSGQDAGFAIAVDNNDNVFVAGTTSSPNFPTTPSAYQTTLIGSGNSFITKLNVAESRLVYSTYLGSVSFRGDNISDLAIDSDGNAYVVGTTDSATFPTTPGAFQTTLNGLTNCFITKLDPTGSSLIYSTYLGGSAVDRGDLSTGMAVDSAGNAFVTGQTRSVDFPTTVGAYQETLAGTNGNCFVTKLNATATQLIYSTYLGGSNPSSNGDRGNDITIDNAGNAYVTGSAQSSNFPTTPGAFQTTLAGSGNGFITKLNPIGSALVYSTLLGGSVFDESEGIVLDGNGNAYVTGLSASSDFPIIAGAFQSMLRGPLNCFVTKLNSSGSALIYSTFLGGTSQDGALSIALDSQGNVCITGEATSPDFPVTIDAFQAVLSGNTNCFVTKLSGTGSDLIYSTYLGGSNVDVGLDIALDNNENIYLTGFTSSANFPITPQAYQTVLAGTANCFISIFVFSPSPPSNFQGKKIENIFLTQTDYINHLSWTPSSSPGVAGYKLFRDGFLIAQISADGPFLYNDHNRKQNQEYIYTLVSFNGFVESIPVTITL